MRKLDPKAVWMFFLRFFFSWLIIFIIFSFWIAGFFSSEIFCGYGSALNHLLSYIFGIFLVFILLVVLCWIWAKLTYRFWAYQLADDAFKKEQGVIWKKYVSIPYERIQNVDIYRGILARILGLSDVYIQTAGYSGVYSARGRSRGAGAEGYLPGIDKDIAQQLREELIKRAKNSSRSL